MGDTEKNQVTQTSTEVTNEGESIPTWWENEKSKLEQRLSLIEASTVENKGYLQRILKLMSNGADEVEQMTPGSNVRDASGAKNTQEGKKPLQVTILNENEKYSFNPAEPGILASKPMPGQLSNMNSPMQYKIEGNLDKKAEPSMSKESEQWGKNSYNGQNTIMPRPKIELQMFDGENPRSWVKKCQKYFTLFAILENQKLEIASMYLTGRAEVWFDGYIMQKNRATWHEFVADLCHRFCDKEHSDVIEEFNKLLQKSTVDEYQERFEELQPFMLQHNAHLGEDYFISSFISGLKEELKHKVKVHEPKTLADACRKAKLYELATEIEAKKYRYNYKGNNMGNSSMGKRINSIPVTGNPRGPPGQNTQKQGLVEYRRANNLCFKCGEKFGPGHQWRPLNILVDSGSTHSFVTETWAKEGLELVQTNPLTITVANGEQLHSTAKSKQLGWRMQGHYFEHDFRVLKMDGSDMVLGVDWMRRYSPIIMDFNEMTLSFKRGNQEVVLHGGKRTPVVKVISGEKMQKLTDKDPDFLGELFFLDADTVENEIPEACQSILEEYKSVFEEPKGLPPQRSHDHAIKLHSESQPVNLIPYRFPYYQKTEVERQIKEMLAASVIQQSKSPFASPCLLVKKKDGSWRLCVDYRQLNSLTIKDKFPIPVVDDLLDELQGAKFFSKIDLRSGYWQIRIKPEDIPKTTFRTYHGHFEFKVMPFGLTNAPATFQSLMNDIFGSFLHKFVLVFFDDILIYSATFDDHLQHLRTVLITLQRHQLFARRKKCFFVQSKVEYLGHIISVEGVATDPSKVEAMRNWKLPSAVVAGAMLVATGSEFLASGAVAGNTASNLILHIPPKIVVASFPIDLIVASKDELNFPTPENLPRHVHLSGLVW
ncbi:hypothetical protein GQ457_02G023110 [Hibiscus cannabinus]